MKRGQMSMFAIIGTLISVVAFASMLPLLSDQIDDIITVVGAGSTTAGVLNFLIPAMALGILFSFLFFVFPSRQGQGGF